MEKTILIPTDFSIESLSLFKKRMQANDTAQYRVIFFHCIHRSDSIMELLFYSEARVIQSLVTKDFTEACTILKNKYGSRIVSDRIAIFTGTTQSAFQNFLEGNRVDEILAPKEYTFKRTSKHSFDPMPFIRNSGFTVTEFSWKQYQNLPEKNQLAELFAL
jgi:hypothetical protein